MYALLGVGNSLLGTQAWEDAPFWFYFSFFVVLILGLSYLQLRIWFYARRRILKQKITTLFEVPFNLNPAEMSYLFYKKLNDEDFAGLLIHMAQRGVVHFRKHENQKVVLPGPKYEGQLKIYEKHILDVLDEHKPLYTQDLIENYKTIFSRDHHYNTFEKQILHGLTNGRHIKVVRIHTRMMMLLKSSILLTLALVVMPQILAWARLALVEGSSDATAFVDAFKNALTLSILLFIPIMIISIGISVPRSRLIGRRRVLSMRPNENWSQVVGFRQYVCQLRAGKLDFDSRSLEKSATLNTLPYAVALGKVKHWKDLII